VRLKSESMVKENPSKICDNLIVRVLELSREIPDGSKNIFSEQAFPINNKLKFDVFPLTSR
jgi:hypothetical protein